MDKIKRVAADQLPLINTQSVLFVPFGWDETIGLRMPLTLPKEEEGANSI